MLIILTGAIVITAIGLYLLEKNGNSDLGGFSVCVGVVGLIVSLVTIPFSYVSHADDLGTIRGQAAVIKVYEDRITQLESRLSAFKYPDKAVVSLDADSPVTSIVKSISEAEEQLAQAKRVKASAIVDIEKRKAGPWAFIVNWKGER